MPAETARRIIIYNDITDVPADLVVGERVELIRGNGPREGASMGFATITANDENGLVIDAEGTAGAASLEGGEHNG